MNFISNRKGFTLVELLVSIAIFSILVTIGVGGFVHALHTQREIAGLISAQSNASVALEQMAREIRTGYLFCDSPGNTITTPTGPNGTCQLVDGPEGSIEHGCTVGTADDWTCTNILDFYNAEGQNVDYALQDGELERSQTGPDGYTSITGSNVAVTYLTFTIFGNEEGDNWPPRITISMGVGPSSTDPAIASDTINLQTTVSARQIDCTTSDPVGC